MWLPRAGHAIVQIQGPEGLRSIEEKDTWHTFNGSRDLLWAEPITLGTKYSLVCYARKPPTTSARKGGAHRHG